MSISPIAAGLAVEWMVLRVGGFGLSSKKAAIVDVVSTVAGVIVIPVLGLLWEVLADVLG